MTLLLFDGYLIMRDEKGKFMSRFSVACISLENIIFEKDEKVKLFELPESVVNIIEVISIKKDILTIVLECKSE